MTRIREIFPREREEREREKGKVAVLSEKNCRTRQRDSLKPEKKTVLPVFLWGGEGSNKRETQAGCEIRAIRENRVKDFLVLLQFVTKNHS